MTESVQPTQVALVTGASRGIGAAIALQLAGNFPCGDQRQFDNDGYAGTRGHDDAAGGGLDEGIGQAGRIDSDQNRLIRLQAIEDCPALGIGRRAAGR